MAKIQIKSDEITPFVFFSFFIILFSYLLILLSYLLIFLSSYLLILSFSLALFRAFPKAKQLEDGGGYGGEHAGGKGESKIDMVAIIALKGA